MSGGGSSGGGDKPGKSPQRTVIAPLPGARGAGNAGDESDRGAAGSEGQGAGNVWSPDGQTPAGGQDRGQAAPGAAGARPVPRAAPPSGGSGQEAQAAPPGGAASPWPAPGKGAPASGPEPAMTGASAGDRHAWMSSSGQNRFFPEVARPTEPAPKQAAFQKIPLEKALQTSVTGHAAGDNPLIGAAAGLLMLLGRLRSQVVDMEAMPLMSHVTAELDSYERHAQQAGADPQQAQVAKYVLCGTADDIVQNLPGTDRDVWVQYAMEARFFNRRTSGVGIFEEIDRALADPARACDLLELMLVCLQLGFEGRYRGAPGGDVDLQRIRRQIYETVRRVRPREDDDISPHWQGIATATHHQRRRVPLWVYTSLVLAVLCGGYIGMRAYLSGDSSRVANTMRELHPGGTIALARASDLPALPSEPEPYEPPEFDPPTQLERVREALSEDIEDGRLTAETRGNFIAVTANNITLFETGSAELREDFVALAERIAGVLNDEPGAVRVVGHTDNVPMSGRGRFSSNQELSVARAESVAGVIRPALDEAGRIEVAGRGPDDPIADNSTPEGRAKNRRVEVLIRREDATKAGGGAAAE